MSRATLPLGKVPVDLLRMLLGRFVATKDSRVLVGPGIGLDAAAIRLGDRVLVAKTDPITFVVDEIGTYALLINAFPRVSDIPRGHNTLRRE